MTGNPPLTEPLEWWKKLTPLQRVIIAVLRAAMSESAAERERKGLYEDAIYGRP